MLQRLALTWILTMAMVGSAAAQSSDQPQYPPQQGYPPSGYQQPYQPQPGGYPPAQPGQPPGQYYPPPQEQGGYYPPGYYPPNGQYPQPPAEPMVSSVEGLIQAGFGTAFVQYTSSSLNFDAPGVDTSRSNTYWGFSNNPLVLEGGYGITPNLLIGGLLQLGGDTVSTQLKGMPKTSTTNFNFLIGPKADYMFSPTSKLNPFAGAAIALAIGSQSVDSFKESRTLFHFRARGGVRYYAFDRVSIDPALCLGAVFGSGSQKNAVASADFGLSAFEFGLTLGLSVWLD